MAAALAYFQGLETSNHWTVVALGDSPNDLGMLDAADIAVAIPNPGPQRTTKTSGCTLPIFRNNPARQAGMKPYSLFLKPTLKEREHG